MTSFTVVRDLIEARCGLRFDDSHRAALSASVRARMQRLGLARADDYCDLLRTAVPSLIEAELRNLLNLVTVTETCFFRDAAQFRLLRDHIIPTQMSERSCRRDGSRTIRIWSAGCSSGEEPYSIAITLDQMGLLRGPSRWNVEIIGTDLNTVALDRARRGVYSDRAVRNVDGRLLADYFVPNGSSFELVDTIKSRVNFEFGNLTRTPMPSTGPQDIVFCKNVAIYFSDAVTHKLIDGLYDTLAEDGYLLLGHAESLWQASDRFTLIEHDRVFCYRKSSRVAAARVTPEVQARRCDGEAQTSLDAGAAAGLKTGASAEAATDYAACLAAFSASDWARAESALTALISSWPAHVPGLLLLGGLFVHRGRLDEAAAQVDRVLELRDLEPRAHLLLGMIAARRERPDEAVQHLRRALYLDDSLALGHFWLANLYRDRGDIARACREYENVVHDFEHNTLQLTHEFASDLTVEQLVGFCSNALKRLQEPAGRSVSNPGR